MRASSREQDARGTAGGTPALRPPFTFVSHTPLHPFRTDYPTSHKFWFCPDPASVTGDSEVGQLASPLKCRMARTIAVEESVTGD